MKNEIWFEKPAGKFVEALPVGNGSMGAMVYGGAREEKISLNLDTFWSGTGEKKELEVSDQMIYKIRQKIFGGRFREAEQLIRENMTLTYTESYMPVGNLRFRFEDDGEISGYRRYLDMERGRAVMEFRIGDKGISYETYASIPQKAVILHIKSDTKLEGIRIWLESELKHQITEDKPEEILFLQNEAPGHVVPNYVEHNDPIQYFEDRKGICLSVGIKAISDEGKVLLKKGEITAENINELTVYVCMESGYKGFREERVEDFKLLNKRCKEQIRKVSGNLAKNLQKEHAEAWAKLFRRVKLELEGADYSELPLDKRLERIRLGGRDDKLLEVYFQYGRYLMIASSLGNSEPANLQGIWNESVRPDFSCNYTININTQMNYWMTGICNLNECAAGLFKMIEELSISGMVTAEKTFRCSGWTANHNTDLWRMSTPVCVNPRHGFWPMGGVWLCSHLYTYYKYEQDLEFLMHRAYPVMKSAGQFCLEWMVEHEGVLQTCPSTSPENAFRLPDGDVCSVSCSSAMDQALVRELFENLLEIEQRLNMDPVFARRIEAALNKMPDYKVGKYGQLQEWNEDFEESEQGHRHFSHLYGLFPGDYGIEKLDQAYVEACRKSIQRRVEAGGGHTGWSCAWLINLYVSLREGDKSLEYLYVLLSDLTAPNFFDLHPPLGLTPNETEVFQIDGNLGAAAAIAFMLLQSQGGILKLLPALPERWKKGSVKGLRAEGGFEVDIQWEDGRLKQAVVKSLRGSNLVIMTGKKIQITHKGMPVGGWNEEQELYMCNTVKGGIYQVLAAKKADI